MKKKHIYVYGVSIKRKKRWFLFFVFLCVFLFLVWLYFYTIVNPVIIRNATSKIKVLANRSMNVAVTRAMEKPIEYSDLIHVVTDENGDISIMQADAVKINTLSKFVTGLTGEQLNAWLSEPIEIPLGSFSGMTIFAGMGPKVEVKVQPYGDIRCTFLSQFVASGINQTQHKIYLHIRVVVDVVLPNKTVAVETTGDVMICEGFLIGKIPDTYLNSDSLDNMLDLVPRA